MQAENLNNAEPNTNSKEPVVISRLSFQYVSWTPDSKFFAISSDTCSWVLTFSTENGGTLISRLNGGGLSRTYTFYFFNFIEY